MRQLGTMLAKAKVTSNQEKAPLSKAFCLPSPASPKVLDQLISRSRGGGATQPRERENKKEGQWEVNWMFSQQTGHLASRGQAQSKRRLHSGVPRRLFGETTEGGGKVTSDNSCVSL
jgi:hypothetical protein